MEYKDLQNQYVSMKFILHAYVLLDAIVDTCPILSWKREQQYIFGEVIHNCQYVLTPTLGHRQWSCNTVKIYQYTCSGIFPPHDGYHLAEKHEEQHCNDLLCGGRKQIIKVSLQWNTEC